MKKPLADILSQVLIKVLAWALEKIMEKVRAREQKAESEAEIDQKLAQLKSAYAEAFDGSEITDEQRQNLKKAIVDFISSPGPGL